VTKNLEPNEAIEVLGGLLLPSHFTSARLFTTSADIQLNAGAARLEETRPTFPEPPSLGHDREKKRRLSLPPVAGGGGAGSFLVELGVVSQTGQPKPGWVGAGR
jgi:hypothetical protein